MPGEMTENNWSSPTQINLLINHSCCCYYGYSY